MRTLILLLCLATLGFQQNAYALSDQYKEESVQQLRVPDQQQAEVERENLESKKSLIPTIRQKKTTEVSSAPKARGISDSPNMFGLIGTILGGAALLFAFIPYIGILSPLLAIGAIVMGVFGLKRDSDTLLSIIALILGGLAILLWIVAIAIVATIF